MYSSKDGKKESEEKSRIIWGKQRKWKENENTGEEGSSTCTVQLNYIRTDLEILSGVGSSALLSLLSTMDGLDSI